MPTPTPTIPVPSVCVALSRVCGGRRGGAGGGSVGGGGDGAVDIEGLGWVEVEGVRMIGVEVEVEVEGLKPSRLWASASLFFSALFFPLRFASPEISS